MILKRIQILLVVWNWFFQWLNENSVFHYIYVGTRKCLSINSFCKDESVYFISNIIKKLFDPLLSKIVEDVQHFQILKIVYVGQI